MTWVLSQVLETFCYLEQIYKNNKTKAEFKSSSQLFSEGGSENNWLRTNFSTNSMYKHGFSENKWKGWSWICCYKQIKNSIMALSGLFS